MITIKIVIQLIRGNSSKGMAPKLNLKFLLFLTFIAFSSTDSNKGVSIPSQTWCGRPTKEIDGALITSVRNDLYKNSACIVKFEADDSFFTDRRIMANLSDIHITDCSKKLSLYYASSSSGIPAIEITCKTPPKGIVETTGKYLTIRLDGSLESPDRFSIVLTTIRPTRSCDEFLCGNNKCIDKDLLCDNINHCMDSPSSDELGGNCLQIYSAVKIGMGIIVGIVLAIIAVCVLCCVLVVCCCCKKRQRGTVIRGPPSQSTTTTQVTQGQMQMGGYQSGNPAQPAYPSQAYYPPGQQPLYPQPYPPGPQPYPPYSQAQQPYPSNAPPPYPAVSSEVVQHSSDPSYVKVPTAPPSY